MDLQSNKLIDAHFHYSLDLLSTPIIDGIICGTTLSDCQTISTLKHLSFSKAFGLHPWFIGEDYKESIEKIVQIIRHNPHALIGEVGLHFSKNDTELQRQTQLDIFNFFLQLSEKENRPMVVHLVKAYNNFIEILKTEKTSSAIMIHSFNTNPAITKRFLQQENIFLSLSPKSNKEIVELIPIERMLLESDEEESSHSQISSLRKLYADISHTKGISMDALISHITINITRFKNNGY